MSCAFVFTITKSSETWAWWVLWEINPFIAQAARSKKHNGKIFIKTVFIVFTVLDIVVLQYVQQPEGFHGLRFTFYVFRR